MDDILCFEEMLTPEQILIRDSVRQLMCEEAMPVLVQAYDQAYFPKALIPKIAALGILGMQLPEEYGGIDADAVSYGLVCQELERADSGIRSFVSVQTALCMYPILRFGTEAQRREFLPRMARGECIGCFGLTEPNVGSDPASMRASAARVPGGWRLEGHKAWITNATIADLAIVWARTGEGIQAFILEKNVPGFYQREIKHKLSMRASLTGELIIDGCMIPDSHWLPGSVRGLGAALACLTQARYGIAWGVMGAAMECYEIALEYTKTRRQFDRPLAACQMVQRDLAEMYSEIVKMQCLNMRAAQLKNQRKLSPELISLMKMNACNGALRVARMARNLLGANGISLEYHVIRHMANLESVFTYEGTDNIHHLVVGRHITGQNAF